MKVFAHTPSFSYLPIPLKTFRNNSKKKIVCRTQKRRREKNRNVEMKERDIYK
jgi:hypothetical protein